MALHLTKGQGAPSEAPTEIGVHYIDEQGKRSYFSVGTDSVNDWLLSAGAGASGTFTALSDTPADYVGQTGKVLAVNDAETGLVFVENTGGGGGGSGYAVWGQITGTLSSQTDLQNELNLKQDFISPTSVSDFYAGNKEFVSTALLPVSNLTQQALNTKINSSEKGAANGVASLDSTGIVPTNQLPSFVSDIEEYASLSNFPATGDSNTIYIALDTNYQYRWTGTQYVQLTDDTAVWGSISGSLSNQADLQSALDNKEPSIAASTNNTFFRGDKTFVQLSKDLVGLDQVDNTSDLAKPISTATQTALDNKEDSLGNPTVNGYVLSSDTSGNRLWVPQSGGGGGGSSSFVGLTDTPSTFFGQNLFGLRVNNNADAVEFYEVTTDTISETLNNVFVSPDEKTQITTNANGVSANAVAISSLLPRVSANESDISDNASDISTNAGLIAANTSSIAGNTSAIGTNTSNISTNTGDIATNASNISSNTSAIAGKEDSISAGTTAQYYRGDKTFQDLNVGTLNDVPNTFGNEGQVLAVNAAGDALEYVDQSGGGGGSFDSLTDTPASKANNAGAFVIVNAAGTDLEYSGGNLWTPADLSVEPISWVDASDESTITESGGNVSLIADKTSNGNDLSQGTGSQQPETGQTLNGLNVLTFDRTTADALVNNTFPIPTSGNISVFTVQSYTAGGGEFDSLLSMDSSTRDWQVSSGSETQFNGRAYTSGIGGNSTQDWVGGPFNGPSIYNPYFNRTGNGRGAYVDGVEVTTEEVYTTGMDASQILRIMANRAGAGSISGILAEMVIVEDQSVETRQLIEGYLKWKWNLAALPSGHPYEFAPPTIAGSGGGFTNLRDTPRALGASGQYVKVNGAGDGLEFGDLVSSASGPMDGGFTSGTWKLHRSGDNITFSFYDAALTVADTSASSTALIPEEMRPPSNITDMYNGDASSLFHCEVTTAGVFTTTQRNYDGTQTAVTAYGSGSITWVID